MASIRAYLNRLIRFSGYSLFPTKLAEEAIFVRQIPYATTEERHILDTCGPYTQTTRETRFALIRAVKYLICNDVPGAFVECGVWKGGSVMAMAMMLDNLGQARELYLFDTFDGMPPGSRLDVDLDGNDERWYREKSDAILHFGKGRAWNNISSETVQKNLSLLTSTKQKFHFVKGRVEETLPEKAPTSIALLRLDTDFYSSTKHELEHLFPLLVRGGILIIDDYGHFLGARRAVDDYFEANDIRILMHRIDYTSIIGIKI